MNYQDRLKTNLLQLFVHPENSEWFSIISIINFEVKIVRQHLNATISPFVRCCNCIEHM